MVAETHSRNAAIVPLRLDWNLRTAARGIIPLDKHVSPGSVVDLGRAANAAVDVGYQARRHLRAILIELRSCGSA